MPLVWMTLFVAVVVGWGVGAIWATRKARERGLPDWQIMAGVVLLGPLCPLLVLVGNGDSKRCPHCMSSIDKRAAVCPKCQRDQVKAA